MLFYRPCFLPEQQYTGHSNIFLRPSPQNPRKKEGKIEKRKGTGNGQGARGGRESNLETSSFQTRLMPLMSFGIDWQ
jgi:hypothetical protein